MKKIFTAIILSLIIALSAVTAVFAGNGDGSGGGSDKPLSLEESSISDGETNVEADREITLVFSKNVVNLSVKENNIACFSLREAGGAQVEISVVMADDQVEPDLKRIVKIVPEKIEEGKNYVLVISGDLQAKSGVTMGADTAIHFATIGAPAVSNNYDILKLIIVLAVWIVGVIIYLLFENRYFRRH